MCRITDNPRCPGLCILDNPHHIDLYLLNWHKHTNLWQRKYVNSHDLIKQHTCTCTQYNTSIILLINNSIKIILETIIEIHELNWIKTDMKSRKVCSIKKKINKRLQT